MFSISVSFLCLFSHVTVSRRNPRQCTDVNNNNNNKLIELRMMSICPAVLSVEKIVDFFFLTFFFSRFFVSLSRFCFVAVRRGCGGRNKIIISNTVDLGSRSFVRQ